jgi:hypothetical protein
MRRARRHLLVAGAGGAAGSALLHTALGDARFDRVTVLSTRPFLRAPARLATAVVSEGDWAGALPAADQAALVFGAARRAREAVYWQPLRADLLPIAAALRARGVRTLELVLADGTVLSPGERRALDALGFDRVDEALPAARVSLPPAVPAPWPERLANWLIRTLIATMEMAQATYRRPPR